MVPTKAFLRDHFSMTDLYQIIELYWAPIIVFMMDLKMAFLRDHHWGYHLGILM